MESFIPFRCCSYTNMLPHWPYVFVGLAMTIYTVYARYFWQGNHLKYTVIYGVCTVFLAVKSPEIYGHIRCMHGDFGRQIT
jgi:hypothetical protein